MGIKSLVAKMILHRVSSRLESKPLSIPLELKGKSLLVLLPSEQRDLTVVKQILPEITRLFGDQSVYLLAYPGTHVQSIFPSKGFRIISPGRSAINWCHLPAKSFLEKLNKQHFDYIFDTNLDDNSFAARVLLNFPHAVRFGNNGTRGLPYLNLEIKTRYLRDRRQIYQSILEVVKNMSHMADAQIS